MPLREDLIALADTPQGALGEAAYPPRRRTKAGHSRQKSWRWRKQTYGFNLSIVHPGSRKQSHAHHHKGMCQLGDYDTKVKRSFKLANLTHDVCLPINLRRNMTLGNDGILKLRLGGWFRPRTNFTKLKNRIKLNKLKNSSAKVSLIGKYLITRVVKER